MLRKKKMEGKKGLGKVSRIVLTSSIVCAPLFGTLCYITAIYTVTESPFLSKCLTFDKCCIVLAKQQYKHVTIWCLSSMHACLVLL